MSWVKGREEVCGWVQPKKNLPFLRHTLHQSCSRHWSSVVTFPHPHIGQKGQKRKKKTLPNIQQIPFTFLEPLITHTVPHICCSSGGARSSKLRSIERGGQVCHRERRMNISRPLFFGGRPGAWVPHTPVRTDEHRGWARSRWYTVIRTSSGCGNVK